MWTIKQKDKGKLKPLSSLIYRWKARQEGEVGAR
jgi:hypothetical protein